MKILQLTVHFYPNIGGVETHLNDLINSLIKRKWEVVVLTYRPLTTKTSWKFYERNKELEIVRLPWLPNFFYKLIRYPLLEFIYLLPGLFLITPLILIFRNPELIHAHGLTAGFIGVFWGKLFNKRVIISTHNIYNFSKKRLYKNFARFIFNNVHYCLCLSKQSVTEIKSLNLNHNRVTNFTYWIDLDKFKKISGAKNILKLNNKFIVLFVGRLVEEKGILQALDSAKQWNKRTTLLIIGTGPLEFRVKHAALEYDNIKYAGSVENETLPYFYSAADILLVPSVSEEGYGRVILESLACGTPIIGANRGAIPEAMDSTVGKFIDVNAKTIKDAVEHFYLRKGYLKKVAKHFRNFAENRFSEKNVEKIIKTYRR